MARIEYIQYRLDNWALWKARRTAGAEGFSSRSALCDVVSTYSGYREPPIPVDEPEATETNAAVESLQAERMRLYETLQLHYPGGLTIVGVARALGVAESTIKARLDQADQEIAAWLRRKRNTPAHVRGSFTA